MSLNLNQWLGSVWAGAPTTLEVAPAGALGATDRPAPVNPREQLVASADRVAYGFGEFPRLDTYRGGYGWHALETFERMFDTPAVKASFDAYRSSVLQNPIELAPAVEADDKPASADPIDEALAVEAAQDEEICASLRRMVHLMETPLDLVLWEMAEAMAFGHTLAEVVYDDVRGGPDDGLWYIRRIRVLDRRLYRLVVDAQMNWVGVRTEVVRPDGTREWQILDPAHFWLMTWDPYRGDPRGRSILRAAVHAWQMLVDLWPDILGGWKQFGRPNVVGILGEKARDVPAVDDKGQVIPGKPPVPALWSLALRLLKLIGGSTLAMEHGGDVKVVESAKGAAEVAGAVTILEEQITKSIVLSTRGLMEAKFGSRADSETSQDTTGTFARIGRRWAARNVRSLLQAWVTLNWGPDIARRGTPLVDLGGTDHQDFAANATAVASLLPELTASQKRAAFNFIGLPAPQPGEAVDTPADGSADPANPNPNAAATVPAGGAA